MRYPSFLKDNQTVGILATSCGNNVNPYRSRCQAAIKNFSNLGYKIKKGHRLFRNNNAVSGPHELRADDFNKFYKNKNIDFIISTGGGEIMLGMLPFIDFEKIKKLPPKYFMGFSDNTNLTFTLTTICDVATIYGPSFNSFCYESFDNHTLNAYKLIKGEISSIDSSKFYEGPLSYKKRLPLEKPLLLDEVKWQSLSGQNEEFTGRIIGGCLDVIISLCGSKFDNVSSFIEKYKDDGIIWYFDNCDLSSVGLYRALFQLKHSNYFKHVKGIVFGRMGNDNTPFDYSFIQAIKDSISDLNIPIIYDTDISHKGPAMPIINGSIAKVSYFDNKGKIEFFLK